MSTAVIQIQPETGNPKMHAVINLDLLGDSIALPSGNEQNRTLEDELITHRRKLLKSQTEIEDLQQKMDSLYGLLNKIRIDLNENQNLFRAKAAALETEQSLLQTSKDESQKMSKEMKKMEAELKEKQESFDRIKATLEKQRKTLENVQKNKEIDKEQFQSMVDDIVDADDLNIAIQKYLILDEKTLTELTTKLSKFNEQLISKQRDTDNVTVEMKAIEMALNRANADFQREQSERNRLLNQWERAIDLLEKRDNDMEAVRRQTEEFRREEFTWRDTLSEKETEVRDQQNTEIELQRRITQLEQQLAKLKSELLKKETEVQQKRDKLLSFKSASNNEKSILKSEIARVAQLNEHVEKNRKKLEDTINSKIEKQRVLDGGKSQNESVDARRTRLKKELDTERQKIEQLEKQRKSLSAQMVKKKEQIASGKKLQKDLQQEFETQKSTQRNLNIKLKQLEKQFSKQKESLNDKENELKQLEKQLELITSRSSGPKDSDVSAVSERSESTKALLIEKEATEQTWTSTIKISQTELEKAKKHFDKITASRREMESTKGVLESEVAILEKRLKKIQEQKREALVQFNLLQAEIKRLQDTLGSKSVEVTNVEEAKETQEEALKAQDQELKQKKSELQIKYFQSEEERKKTNLKLNDIQNKTNLLATRYDAYIRDLPDLYDPNIENCSRQQTKERDALQKTHDDLVLAMNKKEKEMGALQNTMRLITERNQTFRQGIVQADRNSSEYQEKLALEKQYQELSEHYKNIRRQIKQYQDQIKNSKDKSIDFEHKLIQLDVESKRAEEKIERLKIDIADQQNKLDRWKIQNEKTLKELERVASAKKRNFFQEDIDLRTVMSLNSIASKTLSELIRDRPEIDNLVSNFCLKSGLELESPSDSGIGSALTRRSTIPIKIKNGRLPLNVTKKNIDVEMLPPIAQRRSQSVHRSQTNKQATSA